ncbi:hypothetical protein ACH35V_00755 [Actinomadura sp. 1N219]|uniref:hypothetical protein n=1 Tax=Actinomadura sp. 1N219 TaxID=3375152 RepID=UPI0037BCF8C0
MWSLLADRAVVVGLQATQPEPWQYYTAMFLGTIIGIAIAVFVINRWVEPKALRERDEWERRVAAEQARRIAEREAMRESQKAWKAEQEAAERKAAQRRAAELEAERAEAERTAERMRQALDQEAAEIARRARIDALRAAEDLARTHHKDRYWLPD